MDKAPTINRILWDETIPEGEESGTSPVVVRSPEELRDEELQEAVVESTQGEDSKVGEALKKDSFSSIPVTELIGFPKDATYVTSRGLASKTKKLNDYLDSVSVQGKAKKNKSTKIEETNNALDDSSLECIARCIGNGIGVGLQLGLPTTHLELLNLSAAEHRAPEHLLAFRILLHWKELTGRTLDRKRVRQLSEALSTAGYAAMAGLLDSNGDDNRKIRMEEVEPYLPSEVPLSTE